MDTRSHFDGTAARQLPFEPEDSTEQPLCGRTSGIRPAPSLRLLQKDIYTELTRRRRRAQIEARRWVKD
jgi:hypothetical protein